MSAIINTIAEAIGTERIVAPEDVEGRPLAPVGLTAPAVHMIRPRTTDELCTTMRLCHAAEQPVLVVGGATGLAGALTPTGGEILISLEAMHAIEIDVDNRVAVAGAGVVLQALQDQVAEHGLAFPLDLGARGAATIGGLIATNAGGEKALRFGMMREQVLGLEVVLANGERLDLMNRMIKNNAGYDLKQLFIGAEGTLGIVTRAVLRLRPPLPERHTGFAALAGFGAALELKSAVEQALGNDLSAFEILWPDLYEVVTAEHEGALPLAPGAGMYVLFEAETGTGRDEEAFIAALMPVMEAGIAEDLVLARSLSERNAMWAIRNNIEAIIKAFMPPIAYDVSVPLAQMEAFVDTVRAGIAARWPEGRMTAFGHMGDNNLHLVVTLGARNATDKPELNRLVYGEVQKLGGSMSAEHGIGADKRAYLHFSQTREAIDMMRHLKTSLDPRGILNPGKLIPQAEST